MNAHRFHVRGFKEQGTTTTPFDMAVLSGMSRYDLCIAALQRLAHRYERASALMDECRALIQRAVAYSREQFDDPPEIRDWVWTAE